MCRGHKPPSLGDPAVQAFLRWLTPACLPKAVLSKGIQHSDALVRYTTLCTLLKIVQTIEAELHTLQTDILTLAAPPAQAQRPDDHNSRLTAPTQHSDALHDLLPNQDREASESGALDAITEAAAAASTALQQQQQLEVPFLNADMQQQAQSLHTLWTAFLLQLQQALRASLPDPQSLLAVLSTLYKTSPQAPSNNAEEAADLLTHDSPQDDSQLLDDEAMAEQTDSAGLDLGVTAPELTASVVLMVLTAYQHCLPEAMSDSHVDVFSLMPQVSCEL